MTIQVWHLLIKNIEKPLQYRSKNLDAKFWIQKLILKNIQKKLIISHIMFYDFHYPAIPSIISIRKKFYKKYTLNNRRSLIEKHWAPVAQLDRALGYGTIGSSTRTFRDWVEVPTLLA